MNRQQIISIFLSIFVLTTYIIFSRTDLVLASENQSSGLIEKISRDYTKKFCNSIGFGLSEESAMRFSFSENKQIFEKRKGFQDLDKKLLASKIAFSVIEGCGNQLNLYGDEDIEDFTNFYLEIDKEN